jgi:DNA-cytosine methyltransferase
MNDFSTEYTENLNRVLKIEDDNGPLVLDLFAGCGGLALGFEAQGFRTIGFEMVSDYCATYRLNLNGECHELVLTPFYRFPKAQVIIGGPPCQPFSVIGKQNGHKDTRDGFPTFCSAVKQLQPDIFLFENVRGMFYRNKWYLDRIVEAFRSLEYIVEYQLLNTANYGVPQKRERLILVGHRGKFNFPDRLEKIVTAGEALGSMAQSIPPESKFLTHSMDKYIKEYERKSECIKPRDLHFDIPSRTLTCRNLCGSTSDMMRVRLPDGRRRRLLIREAARLQSFPDWFNFVGNESSQFNQIGNAVPPMFAYHLAGSIKKYLHSASRHTIDEIRSINMKSHSRQQADLPLELKDKSKQGKLFPDGSDILDSSTFRFILTAKEQEKCSAKGMACKSYDKKTKDAQKLINEALYVIAKLGVPVMDKNVRGREMMALSFLAICGISKSSKWAKAKSLADNYALSTRDIITYINDNFRETISSGSYDDIRRKHLLHLRLSNIVLPDKPKAKRNDPQRKWGLSKDYIEIIRSFGQPGWEESVNKFLGGKELLVNQLQRKRAIQKIPVTLPSGVILELELGEHNEIQKAIIEEFLPRYGFGAEVIYVGDASDKLLHYDKEKASAIGLADMAHEELPDVIAYSPEKNGSF